MGYRRTGSNIFKTRSNKKMTSLVSKTMTYGMLAPFAILDSLDSVQLPSTPYTPEPNPQHYNYKKHIIVIICSILALACPIVGYITYVYGDWWMFFSVLVFGFLETIFCICADSSHYPCYIYQDEIEWITRKIRTNNRINIITSILLLILNFYPIFLCFGIELLPDYYYYYRGLKRWEIQLLPTFLIIIKLILNILYTVQTIGELKYVYPIQNRHKTEKNDNVKPNSKTTTNQKVKFEDTTNKHKNSKEIEKTNTNKYNITMPKINGEYTEEFMNNHGTLRIGSNHALIEFYFPGPDDRYKGTFISIQENEIDNYINAYKNNWQTAEEVQVKISDTPEAKFNQLGEMGMNITVTQNSINLCIDNYHLPICSKKDCDNIIEHFNIAKYRIKEIRQRLFE